MADIEAAIKDVLQYEAKQSESAERKLAPGYQEDKIPIHAYGPFFLRGLAKYSYQDHRKALDDLEMAVKLRPAIIKDTGEFR
ncbi:hypothetical protein BT69DRAFT_1155394 [Atractiella rhizophila]|nr:hypothetical protein BT69DRAFT_1155394 [Atractiella rhizophila]